MPDQGLTFAGWDPSEDSQRKQLSLDRLLMLEGEWASLVRKRITQVFDDGPTLQRVLRFASTSLNVAASILRPLSTAYDPPPRRFVAGASDEIDAAFADLVRSSKINVLGPQLNYIANFVGVVAVAPILTSEGVTLQVWYPHQLDLSWRQWAPMTSPDSVCVTLYKQPSMYAGYGSYQAGVESNVRGYVTVDSESWAYYGPDGQPSPELAMMVGGLPGDHVIPHGLGYLPVSFFRTRPPGFDFWGLGQTRGLYDATLEAALVYSIFSWVRKYQNRRVATFGFTDSAQGDEIDAPDQQPLDPENALQLGPSEAFNSYDLDTPPKRFIEHLDFILDRQADQWGLPPASVGLDAGNSELSVSVAATKLLAIRSGQIPFMIDAEEHLWRTVWDLASRTDTSWGEAFRSDPEARNRITVEFPAQSLVDDPVRREELYRQRASRGGTNPIEAIQADHPHLTREQARAQYEENLRILAETNEALARVGGQAANQTTQATLAHGIESISQITGREGGRISLLGNRENSEDNDNG